MLTSLRVLAVSSFFTLFATGLAQQATQMTGRTLGDGLVGMGLALGAGFAIGLAAIGVGLAQAAIGSAGAGTLAERPQAFGQILIYLVIPETLIIFGFVIAFFLNGKI